MGKDLKKRLVSGVIWSAFDSFSGLAIQMICSLIVARLLTPSDFGIVGMISVFSAIGLIIIDSGFGQALIRKQDANQVDFTSVFYLNILLSLSVYLILYICSPYIENFYKIEGLSQISRVLFLIIPINAFGLIQNTILTKKVDFKTLGIISVTAALISGVIGIVFAYKLRSVWAIVFQTLGMYAFRTILLWVIPKWKPIKQFSISSIKEMFPFASNLMFTGLFSTIVNNICPLIIGKIYSATQLGYFSQADKLQKLPSATITNVIQRVTYPILSEVQDDNKLLCNAYTKILGVSVFIIAPIMVLLILIAENLFLILLGEQWLPATTYFQILCISGIFYPISCLSLNLINVKGRSKLLFKLEILRKVVFTIIILISINYGMLFFIWMQAFYSILQLFINLTFSGKQIGISLLRQLNSFLPEVIISLLCAIPPLILISIYNMSCYFSLFSTILFYTITYITLSKVVDRVAIREIMMIIKRYKK